MKIDILVANNLYDSTASFAKSLKKAFVKLGNNVRIFKIDEENFFHAYYKILENPSDFTCSFSDIHCENLPLSSFLAIPHLSLLIDPAIYSLHHLKGIYPYIASVDEGDVAFIKSFDFQNVFFLPHAADPKDWRDPFRPRHLQEVFFGTCIDLEGVHKRWKIKYPKKTQEILHEASHIVLSQGGTSTLSALKELKVADREFALLHHEVDLFTRGKDRVELLKNRKVHIWGEGPWLKYCPKATVFPATTFENSLKIMKESQIVYNSSPRFKQGSHERIFNALMTGACPVTFENSFIKKTFAKDELITYHLGEWEFSNSHFLKRAEKGQQKVLAYHTWDNRAQTILDFMQSHLPTNTPQQFGSKEQLL